MKISIITISFNSEKTIERTIRSVLSQKNIELEYCIVDGGSSDNTLNIIKEFSAKYPAIRYISEKDNGIYDAMNKGINMSSGDVIGILNSDDFYASDEVLEKVCKRFEESDIDSCFGNILYIKSKKDYIKPYRMWRAGRLRTLKFGWMPPHPSFFVRKTIYEKYGVFRLDCGTAADYELMLRFLEKYKISSDWVNMLMVYMEAGGASGSSVTAYKKSTKNDYNSWRLNGLKPIFGFSVLKKIRKIPQFVQAKFIKI